MNLIKLYAVIIVSVLVTACGGGGGASAPATVTYAVTASAGAGGAISPTSSDVDDGGTVSLTVTPDTGYSIASVTGCGGGLTGNTYTTAAVTAACIVDATFSLNSYTVSATAGTNGAISPASSIADHGATTSFTVTPDASFSIASVTGCGGSLTGNTYTTAAVTAACTVDASFALNTYTVSTVAATGGAISPVNPIVDHGTIASLTVTPELGYIIGTVTGCVGTLVGDTYTTGAVTAACTVDASFILVGSNTVTANAGLNGVISPASIDVTDGLTTGLTVTPDTDYLIDTIVGCGGTLVGDTYTTGAVIAPCAVDVTFIFDGTHTVTANAGANGTITPAIVDAIPDTSVDFQITPDADYSIDSVTGCAGFLVGPTTYRTSAITAACTVDVTFINNVPVAVAKNVVSEVLSSVELDGSASSDESALTYSWSVVSVAPGSAVIALVGDTTANPTFTPDVEGDYQFTLVVNDGVQDSTPITITVTAISAGTAFYSADAFPIDLPLGATITSTIDVSGGPVALSYVRVYMDLSHTWDADVIATLTSPTGTVIDLVREEGGSASDFSVTTFDDFFPTTSIIDGVAPFNGLFYPEQALSTFNGEAADGIWTLTVTDLFDLADSGVLNSWRIVFPDSVPVMAKVGADQLVAAGDMVQLDGSTSAGDLISFSWQLTAMPAGSAAVLSDAGIANPTFTADLPGEYLAELTVTDGVDVSTAVVSVVAQQPYDPAVATTYNSTDTPIAIPDNDIVTGASSSILVSADVVSLSGVAVRLSISHTWSSDLNIYLVSPAGTQIELSIGNGGSATDAYIATGFSDLVASSIIGAPTPYTGYFQPEVPLSTLIGEDSNGTWQLLVFDGAGADTGNIESWDLHIW
ncbi:MAG: proprotein convertase P-domain-containing protein [Gammaproteobacteria bacterium]|nr:proprotein convertase P-domain-containing protein [Gammaproteobacteria bacterium]